jgi:hypothetical protein
VETYSFMQTTNCDESPIFLTVINFAFVGVVAEENKSKSKLDLAGLKLQISDTEHPRLISRSTYNQPYIKIKLTLRVSETCIVSHMGII